MPDQWRMLNSVFLLALLAASWLCLTGCRQNQSQRPPLAQSARQQTPSVAPEFDGLRAFDLLVTQTKFGARVPNTDAHRNCRFYLGRELQKYADSVWFQEFTHAGYDGKALYLSNVLASFNKNAKQRILLCAHWDSRPWADQDPDPKNRQKPVPGANDGASGVAILLELARHLKAAPPQIGVDIVFFDGEDYGRSGDLGNYLLGSRYFAENKPADFNPEFAILLDMVGDKQLEIPKEQYSMEYAPDIVGRVWAAASEVGSTAFLDSHGEATHDDHIPLNRAGIKAIDIIDFDYPDQSNRYWHTIEDTPDKCSPESLKEVGDVLVRVIYSRPQ